MTNLGNRESITRSPMAEGTIAIGTNTTPTTGDFDLSGASSVRLRSPDSNITSVSIYAKGINNVYSLSQIYVNGAAENSTYTLTGAQPLTVPCLGLREVRFVGNAAGNLEVSPVG